MKNIRKIIQTYDAKAHGVQKGYAVLLPLIKINGDYHILYEVRSEHVSQAGDTSFPGGRIETGESPKEAAVRETMEELNIKTENIDVIGEIDYIISYNRIIYCYVGEIIGIDYRDIFPNIEVERLFTVPLDHLLENGPTVYNIHFKQTDKSKFPYHLVNRGMKYPFSQIQQAVPFYELKDETLWGFTANLTDRFIQIIKEDKEADSDED
ncbi:NUDIX hydrolase [Aerococcaceae bacterium WGS1372]